MRGFTRAGAAARGRAGDGAGLAARAAVRGRAAAAGRRRAAVRAGAFLPRGRSGGRLTFTCSCSIDAVAVHVLQGAETRLEREQGLLARQPAAVAGELAVGADHPVARHDHDERVLVGREPDGAGAVRLADRLRDLAVAARLAVGNRGQRAPHLQLVLGARGVERQAKRLLGAAEILLELLGQWSQPAHRRLPGRAGVRGGVRGERALEAALVHELHVAKSALRGGQEDQAERRGRRHDVVENAHGAAV